MNDFAVFYREHYGLLFTWIMSRVRNRAAAEDIVSASFALAWTHRDTLRDPKRAKAWLYQITANELAAWGRRLPPLSLDAPPPSGLNEWPVPDPVDFTENLAHFLEWERAAQVATALSRAQRQALTNALQGLSTEESAAQMGVALGTAQSRLFTARRTLQRLVAA